MSRPIMEAPMELKTSQAQYAFQKLFENVDKTLFFLTVALQAKLKPEEVAKVSTELEGKMASIRAEIFDFLTPVQKGFSEKGIKLCAYTSPLKKNVRYNSRLGLEFLNLLVEIDTTVAHCDTAWMLGILSDSERNEKADWAKQQAFKFAHYVAGVRKRFAEEAPAEVDQV